MSLCEPTSAEECIYFTNRYLGDKGQVMCWVPRKACEKCGKAQMGKPRDSKGNVKIRAKEYVCPECHYTIDKQSYEDTLTANIKYTCHKCEHSSELQLPFKRKKVEGISAIVFQCQKCKTSIPITKKMKELGESEGE